MTRTVARPRGEPADVSYRERSLALAIEEADKVRATLHRIEFMVRRVGGHEVLHAYMDRNLETRLYGGDAGNFLRRVLLPSWHLAHRRSNLLHDRSRCGAADMSRPLSLTFGRPVFETVADNRRLIHALAQASGSGVAVYHSNPYVHSCFIDYFDGSSCDVVLCDESTVQLIPGERCSLFSLMRLCDALVMALGDAEIADDTARRYSFAHFFRGGEQG